MSDLVGNPEDWFSHVAAQMTKESAYLNFRIFVRWKSQVDQHPEIVIENIF